MKKTIIALVTVFIAVLLLGSYYQRASLYEPQEIEKANSEMLLKVSTLQNDIANNSTNLEDSETTDSDLPPEIEIIYPSKFKDGDTIETDKVELKFTDDNKVVKATMNDIDIPTDAVRINTEGTYNIEIKDEVDNKATLSFTIKLKEEETTATTTKTPTTQKKPKTSIKPKPPQSDTENTTTEDSNENTNEEDNTSPDDNTPPENEPDPEDQVPPIENQE